jgi:hypothetical protein
MEKGSTAGQGCYTTQKQQQQQQKHGKNPEGETHTKIKIFLEIAWPTWTVV